MITGDCRERLAELEPQSVNCCVTSPPYFGLRDYGHAGQIGLEDTPDAFVAQMVAVFREVRRVLRDDGTLWLNIGDGYAGPGPGSRDPAKWPRQSRNDHAPSGAKTRTGLANKQLLGVPWRLALALQADGWFLRFDTIWRKSNAMPDPAKDRPARAHEYVFLFSKGPRYYFRETSSGFAGETSVWTIATEVSVRGHAASYPVSLAQRCIVAGSEPGDMILDPFAGSGTTGVAAHRLSRDAVLIELNPEYAAIAERRLHADAGMFADVA